MFSSFCRDAQRAVCPGVAELLKRLSITRLVGEAVEILIDAIAHLCVLPAAQDAAQRCVRLHHRGSGPSSIRAVPGLACRQVETPAERPCGGLHGRAAVGGLAVAAACQSVLRAA